MRYLLIPIGPSNLARSAAASAVNAVASAIHMTALGEEWDVNRLFRLRHEIAGGVIPTDARHPLLTDDIPDGLNVRDMISNIVDASFTLEVYGTGRTRAVSREADVITDKHAQGVVEYAGSYTSRLEHVASDDGMPERPPHRGMRAWHNRAVRVITRDWRVIKDGTVPFKAGPQRLEHPRTGALYYFSPSLSERELAAFMSDEDYPGDV